MERLDQTSKIIDKLAVQSVESVVDSFCLYRSKFFDPDKHIKPLLRHLHNDNRRQALIFHTEEVEKEIEPMRELPRCLFFKTQVSQYEFGNQTDRYYGAFSKARDVFFRGTDVHLGQNFLDALYPFQQQFDITLLCASMENCPVPAISGALCYRGIKERHNFGHHMVAEGGPYNPNFWWHDQQRVLAYVQIYAPSLLFKCHDLRNADTQKTIINQLNKNKTVIFRSGTEVDQFRV